MAGKLTIEFSCNTGCNLKCSYCYSRHIENKMSKEIADLFFQNINVFLKEYNKDSYHISYFGGEPLTNWEIIEYTLPKFFKDEKCQSYVVITNGLLLTKEKIDFLKKYKCGISLSFDGIWQDINRPQSDKSSSFDFFIKNKDLIHSITNSCKVMIQPKNFGTMTENLEFFVEKYNFLKPDFCLVRDAIYKKEDIETYEKEIERLANKVIEYQNQGINASVGLFDLYTLDILANQKFGKRNHGCFVGISGCLYAPNGSFWPCERFHSANKFKLFDKDLGIIKENVEFLSKPENNDPRVFEDCKNCEIYDFCNVGCTFSELREGRWNKRKPVNSVCDLFKLTYKQALRVYANSNKEYKNYLFKRLEKGS